MAIGSPRPWSCLPLLAVSLTLGGCIESGTLAPMQASATSETARHAEASPRGAPVTFASLDGPPPAVTGRFLQALNAQAAGRDIAVTDAKSARYVVRGYMSVYPAADGTALAYVWDVFDRDHRLAQRLTGSVAMQGAAADPWSLVDDKSLASAAAKSADDLASFLGSTPEGDRRGTAGARCKRVAGGRARRRRHPAGAEHAIAPERPANTVARCRELPRLRVIGQA